MLPGRFVPWLEQDPCFYDLGNWIMEQALADGVLMVRRHPGLRLNVNGLSCRRRAPPTQPRPRGGRAIPLHCSAFLPAPCPAFQLEKKRDPLLS